MREESIRVDTNELRLWRLQICCDRGTQVAFSQRIVSLILVILVWKRFLDNSPYLQIIISECWGCVPLYLVILIHAETLLFCP